MEILVTALLPMAVVIIMFSLGLGLTPSDFRRIVERPRAFWVGALNQVILLPVIAYAVTLIFGFTCETAVGIMILAAYPGGAASNVVTKLAGWDIALSVTLTAIFSLTCVVTIPFILEFALIHFMGETAPDIDIASTAITAFMLTAIPITFGVTLHAAFPRAVATMDPTVNKAAMVLFAGVVIGAVAANWLVVMENIARLGIALLVLVGSLSVGGFAVSRILGTSDNEAKTIAVETGVQNGALALAIAGLLVANGPILNAYAIPAALYGVVWLATTLPVFLFIASRHH